MRFREGWTDLLCPCVLFRRNVKSLREDTPLTKPCVCHAIFVEGGIGLAAAQYCMVSTRARCFYFMRVFYLVGGCVAYTLVSFGSPCRRSIISRAMNGAWGKSIRMQQDGDARTGFCGFVVCGGHFFEAQLLFVGDNYVDRSIVKGLDRIWVKAFCMVQNFLLGFCEYLVN